MRPTVAVAVDKQTVPSKSSSCLVAHSWLFSFGPGAEAAAFLGQLLAAMPVSSVGRFLLAASKLIKLSSKLFFAFKRAWQTKCDC